MVGQHVAVEEQGVAGAAVGQQAIAALGAAFVAGEADQAGGGGELLHGAAHLGREQGVAAGVVQQHQLDGALEAGRLAVQRFEQGARVVAVERGQNRQARLGLGPEGVVDQLERRAFAGVGAFGPTGVVRGEEGGLAHAAALVRRVCTSRPLWVRAWPASSRKATAA